MNRSVKVKVCGMTREGDVEMATTLGADFIGCITYTGSPRGLSLLRATQLAALVPAGQRVIVDVETSLENLMRYREAGFDYFQIHSKVAFEESYLAELASAVGRDRLWLAPRLAPDDPFPEYILKYAETVLLDTYSASQVGGTGQTGDWGRFPEFKASYPETQLILAGGLSPDNVQAAIQATGTDHIDVNSGVESEPGIKNPEKLRELFRVLRA